MAAYTYIFNQKGTEESNPTYTKPNPTALKTPSLPEKWHARFQSPPQATHATVQISLGTNPQMSLARIRARAMDFRGKARARAKARSILGLGPEHPRAKAILKYPRLRDTSNPISTLHVPTLETSQII